MTTDVEILVMADNAEHSMEVWRKLRFLTVALLVLGCATMANGIFDGWVSDWRLDSYFLIIIGVGIVVVEIVQLRKVIHRMRTWQSIAINLRALVNFEPGSIGAQHHIEQANAAIEHL